MSELRDEKLDFWIKNKLNVLFSGKHGVGKTARVLSAFDRAGLRYMYFSGSTMDPWVDFVGVPRAVKDEKGEYLDFVLPKGLRDDTVQAIFIDEYNRSHKKIRNAVMELIQFKSINGRKFQNLEIVWAAINPDEGEDESYQVEPMDPAQEDRFHVHVNVPYKPCAEYFRRTYGSDIGRGAIAWWNDLPDELKKKVSPRRLDYALNMYKLRGDLSDILPHGCNIGKLLSTLKSGPTSDRLKALFNNRDSDETKKFLDDENNYAASIKHLVDDIPIPNTRKEEWMGFFLPLLSTEKISSLLSGNEKACDFILDKFNQVPIFQKVTCNIFAASQNKKLKLKIKKRIGVNQLIATQHGNNIAANLVDKPYFNKTATIQSWQQKVTAWKSCPTATTPQRLKIYEELIESIPPLFVNAQDAVDGLELLTITVGRCWPDMLKEKKHLIGGFNHLISEIARITGKTWSEINKTWGSKFDKLVEKINKAGLSEKMLIPGANIILPQQPTAKTFLQALEAYDGNTNH
jgi:hypothetical protein